MSPSSAAASLGQGSVNWYYVLTIFVIGSGSIPKGYDEGGFSAALALPSFKNDYNLDAEEWLDNASGLASRKANITSLGVLGAAFGSLLALAMTDRIGRVRSWRLLTCVYMSGYLMQVFSSGIYGFLLFARVWGGLGAGGLTVVGPLYLSEISPAKSRGMIVSTSMVFLLSFLSLGFFINYAASVTMPAIRAQYRLVIAIPLIPMGLAFLASFLVADTPRWLASKNRGDEALGVLARLRNTKVDDKQLQVEYLEIQEQVRSQEKLLSETSNWSLIKEIWSVPSYRKRFLLATAMQTVAQWSGGNGITYYIPQIFVYAGVTAHNKSLITSGAYGIVKLVFTMVFTWGMVDIIGRRRCFIAGLSLQLAAHVFMAIYMGVWVSHDHADKAASDAAIASVFVYAVGWSIGLCTVQYLYGTEIFPTRIRNVCYAFNMALHWFFQFAVVRVTPNMFVSLHIYGTYIFYAVISFAGLVLLGLWAPETKGVPMERMEELFSGHWWLGWKAKVDVESSETQTLRRSRASSPAGIIERAYDYSERSSVAGPFQ
ncbi:putative MFS quinate transporter [Cryphonectria parasitica EP155]|uniref:MFS quinate transporter n=1 Tax=Cryphonectria parasitica (strain ATCC 38755 / EP155) TaxID=660469 RepID=A0A9P4XT47_CRYP1|nr:putative MFS quinate transporter [Cryphonectria parasitica EP155]KAF3760438.1 putative MFS quinate transporter [Cryphonectria parasitica EP155]